MKKLYFLLTILIFSCGKIEEDIIGYEEIVHSAWMLFSNNQYEEAKTEFTNALDYEVLNNVAEAYIGIGWCNLYIANQFTNLEETEDRNELRDIAYSNFISAQDKDNNAENSQKISDELNTILYAGLVFVYDYRLLDYNYQYYNYVDEIPSCEQSNSNDLNDFRSHCIIPIVKLIVKESGILINDFQTDFEFPYDETINIDDIYFIRARLAFSFDDFTEFCPNNNIVCFEENGYFLHDEEICKINELTQECLNLGIEEYCNDNSYNIPVEDFLGCLSSFYTPTNNP